MANGQSDNSNSVGVASTGGAIHQTNAPIQTMQRQVATQAESPIPGFGAAYSALALTPTALGEASATVAQQNGIAIAKQQGQRLGKNPEGDLLPAFTATDQAFVQSYSSQAQATLGLQAQQLMDKSQEQLANSYMLSSDQINTVTQKTAEGLQGILQHAPSTVRGEMENQYASQLENVHHQLNIKMIGEQKELATQKSTAWRMGQSIAMQNAAKDGNTQLAEQIHQSINANLNASLASGQINPVQAQTALIANKVDYNSSLLIQQAMSARRAGTLEPFLEKITDQKIPGLSWSESEAARNNVLSYIGQVESGDRRQEQLTLAQGNNLIQTGMMTPAKLAEFQSQLQPTDSVNLATAYAVSQRTKGIENQKVSFLTANANNAKAYAGMTAQTINAVHDNLTQGLMQNAQSKGVQMSPDEAEFQAAAYMKHPVPKYLDGLNQAFNAGSPQQAFSALEQFHRLHAMAGFKTVGIDDKALAVGETFRALMSDNNADPQAALDKARDIVQNKSEDIIKMNRAKTDEYMNKHASTPSKVQSWAIKTSGVASDIPFQDADAFTADMKSQFQAYMQYTNGNSDVSAQMLKTYAAKTYGVTRVNGEPQNAYLPIDKSIEMDNGGTALIQEDIRNQLQPQLDAGKKAFDNGTLPYYWRLKEREGFDQYAMAKDAVRTKGLSDPEYAFHKQLIAKYEEAPAIEIEQVMRNNTVNTFKVIAQTTAFNEVSPVTGEVMGPYNIMIKDPITGIPSAIHGYFGKNQTLPEYRPDADWIHKRYLAVNGLTYTNPAEDWKMYEANKEKRGQDYIKETNALLRSFH